MLDVPDMINYDDLNTAQRQALVENELKKWQDEAQARAHTLFRKSGFSKNDFSTTINSVVRIDGNAASARLEAPLRICF